LFKRQEIGERTTGPEVKTQATEELKPKQIEKVAEEFYKYFDMDMSYGWGIQCKT
jgi:hypothetical protein